MSISSYKRLRGIYPRGQAGFTMVELAIVLVIAGIILFGALKGTDMINKAKIERTVADIRGIQGMIFEHEKRTGRLAGDCTATGFITNGIAIGTRFSSDPYSPDPKPSDLSCFTDAGAANSSPSIDTPWGDLRKANIIDPSRLNTLVAKNQNNSYYAIGSIQVKDQNNTTQTVNAIAVYDIPLWMAKGIDVAIDGPITAATGLNDNSGGQYGRIRLLSPDGTTTTDPKTSIGTLTNADWPSNTSDDSYVSIIYIFDRAVPSGTT